MRATLAHFALLILTPLYVFTHSMSIYNLTLPINHILQNGDKRYQRILRRSFSKYTAPLYSTELNNETFGILLKLSQFRDSTLEEYPFCVELTPAKNISLLDLEAIKGEYLRPTNIRKRVFINFYVKWEPTTSSNGCARDVSEKVGETLMELRYTGQQYGVVNLRSPLMLAYNSKDIGCSHLLNSIAELEPRRSSLLVTIDFHVDDGYHHELHVFNDFLSVKIRENKEFISAVDSPGQRRKVYYSFRLLPSSELLPASKKGGVSDRDHLLFYKFREVWEAENRDLSTIRNTLNFDLDTVPSKLGKIMKRWRYPKDVLVPFVEGRDWYELKYGLPAVLCEVATRFDAVEVSRSIWNHLLEIDPISCATTNTTSARTPLKLNVYHVANNETLSSRLSSASSDRKTSVLIKHPKYSSDDSDSFRGCHIRFGNLPEPGGDTQLILSQLVNHTISECSDLVPRFSYVLWDFDLVKGGSHRFVHHPKFYRSTIHPQLSLLSKAIDLFGERVPGAQIAVKLELQQPVRYSKWCDEADSQSRQIFTVLMNWAFLNNVPLFFDTGADAGFSDALLKSKHTTEYFRELHSIAMKWPEFASRNYPSNLDGFYPWGQDPCVNNHDTTFYSQPINFDEFAGATLNMTLRDDNKPLSPKEVRTLLQFAFHRFSTLEIIVGGAGDGRILLEALSPRFLKFLVDEGATDSKKVVYISIPNEQLLQGNQLQLVINSIHSNLKNISSISLGGVHVASSPGLGDMNRNIELLEKVVTMTTDGVRLGLAVKQCEQLVGALLNSTSSGPPEVQLNSKIGYLVCPISVSQKLDFTGNYYDYADAIWYLARVLKRRVPNLTLIANTRPFHEEELLENIFSPDHYIQIINYSVNHASVYKLKKLVVTPVSHSSTPGLGWWKITNYSDLSDTRVYKELESAFQDNEQEDLVESTSFQRWSTWAGVGTIGAVLFIAVISLAVWNCVLRGRVDILTKQEIYEFRNGGLQVEVGVDSDLISTLKYDASYEISKEEMNLGSASLLGMGNFGQVRKGSVRGNLAAIKMPNDNCSKDSFKSMLIEVKVMCHLGSHPNLVELVGCHTSEIRRGMIYIVTVLCENGSLQSCLRNKDAPPVQFQEMVKFAHEIACGMDYIAGKYVVHGDLATRNVLMDSHNICKIGDFGLSRKLYEYSMYVKESQEPLPWRWLAYESLLKMEFTSNSDVWSFGVTLWEIFSLGAVPYPGVQWSHGFVDELKAGLRMNSPEFATPDIYEMMLKCWDLEPKARPNFEELVGFFIPFRDAEYEDLGN